MNLINIVLPILSLIIGLLTFIIAYIVYYNNTVGDVVVYAKVDLERQGLILLVIHNIGKGIAQDIQYKGAEAISKNSSGYDIGALISGTPILFPDEKLIYSLGMYHTLKKSLDNQRLEIDISFYSKTAFQLYKRRIKNQVILDINAFSGVDIGEPIFQSEVKKSLREISASLKKIS